MLGHHRHARENNMMMIFDPIRIIQQEMACALFHTEIKVRETAKIRNPTPDPVHHTGENDKGTRKHHIQESQEVSPFPTANHKAAIDRLH